MAAIAPAELARQRQRIGCGGGTVLGSCIDIHGILLPGRIDFSNGKIASHSVQLAVLYRPAFCEKTNNLAAGIQSELLTSEIAT